jgi:hypothetical protein
MNEKFVCPDCGKTIIDINDKNFSKNDLIIKSRLIFLNDNGEVFCRCVCKSIINLPLSFINKNKKIVKK